MLNIKNEEEKFLTFISDMIDYWNGDNVCGDQKYRMEGLAFSILSHIDGSSGEPYALIPYEENGSRYDFYLDNDISGCLHEKFFEIHRENSKQKENNKEETA
ncbi:MAG: hypothetical protein IJ086_00005 [Clostridium sp.]|nr:hypothetical protein [Clostridium sp.]